MEQNNKIIEAIEYASDSYWGDPNRWKFKASIDSFATTVNVENGADRAAKSTFNIKLNGYLIPDTVNKDLAATRNKFYTKSQVIFDLEVVDSAGQVTNFETLRFANKPQAQNSLAATSFVGGGVNVTNATVNIDPAASGDLNYLNTNITKVADIVTAPNTAIFTSAALLQPPAGSSLPPTSKNNFYFYINGQNINTDYVTLVESGGNVTLTFNTTSIGYTLTTNDEVIAIGKFQ
jgi:hypothetical protein